MKKLFFRFMIIVIMILSVVSLAYAENELIDYDGVGITANTPFSQTLPKAFSFSQTNDFNVKCEKTSVFSNDFVIRIGGVDGSLGLNEQVPVKAGARCSVGDFIKFKYGFVGGDKPSKEIFNRLWFKSSNDDLMVFSNYEWSRNGIFLANHLYQITANYECYKCSCIGDMYFDVKTQQCLFNVPNPEVDFGIGTFSKEVVPDKKNPEPQQPIPTTETKYIIENNKCIQRNYNSVELKVLKESGLNVYDDSATCGSNLIILENKEVVTEEEIKDSYDGKVSIWTKLTDINIYGIYFYSFLVLVLVLFAVLLFSGGGKRGKR